jgi:hypothetical protein
MSWVVSTGEGPIRMVTSDPGSASVTESNDTPSKPPPSRRPHTVDEAPRSQMDPTARRWDYLRMRTASRLGALWLSVAITVGCDCKECGGLLVEVVDIRSDEVIEGAEVVYASSIYGPRHPVDGLLSPGTHWIWARAPGYGLYVGQVEVELVCVDHDDVCPRPDTLIIPLEER